MNISRKTSFAMGAIVALVLGSGTAYAATGSDFIIGKTNHARTKTVLANSEGTALVLKSDEGKPPLKVNRSVKVPKLNADKVDGRSETAFALAAGGFGTITASGVGQDFDINGIPDLISATATCPAGTQRTGGGFTDFTATGSSFYNAPDSVKSWTVVVATDNSGEASETDVKAFVLCYNPRGSVNDDKVRTPRSDFLGHLSPAVKNEILEKVATR